MREALLEQVQRAVQSARRAGAEHAWAWASRSREVEFRMRGGALEHVEEGTSQALSLRLYVQGRYAVHTTSDLRPAPLAEFLKEAVALTRALEPDVHRRLPDPALYVGRPADLELHDPALAARERAERLAQCAAMNERVTGADGVVSATSAVSDAVGIVAGASSNGFADAYETSSATLFTMITLREGERRPEGHMVASARHLGGLPSPEVVADEALRQARARLGMVQGPTRRTLLVVDPRAAGRLIGQLLGPASGSAVQQQRSFWAGRIGQPAVSEKLTITDDPLLPRGLGSRPFDGEGIAARRRPLLERGELRQLYVDTYYASKLGAQPTTGSSSNCVVAPGTRDLHAIVAAVGSGIYVTSWLGGNMDSTTGDFSIGARGHAIERGEIGAALGEMSVTGNVLELFSQLREVGSDPWPYSALRAPTLAFENVQFSGA